MQIGQQLHRYPTYPLYDLPEAMNGLTGYRAILNPEKSFRPRKTQKARKFSNRYQTVDRHPKGKWLYQLSVLICFVFFDAESAIYYDPLSCYLDIYVRTSRRIMHFPKPVA